MSGWRHLALLVAAVSVACGQHDQDSGMRSPGSISARLTPAERLEVRQEVELQGTVEARQTAAISARVMAMVTAIQVRVGEQVKRGQLLLEIDPQTATGQLAQAQGALGQARAALALAQRNYERFVALAEADAASELEVDMARMQYEQAQGAVDQAAGAVEAASSVAEDTRVEAPFSGRIAQRLVEVGDLASPGRPLLTLESIAGRRLVTPVPESLMQQSRLQVGDRLRVRIDAREDLGDLEGTVVEITPGADPASHSFRIKLELPAPDLVTGAAGRAWIPSRPRSAVVVPAAAVLSRGGMDLVVVRDAEGLASSRVVTVGQTLGDGRREILSGLSGGETVLVGLAAIPPIGSRVEEIE